jgi:hypothetical protein
MAGFHPSIGFSLYVYCQVANLMRSVSFRLSGVGVAFAFCAAAATPAVAMDPVCNQVKTVMQVLRTMPMHIYMTETQSFANPTLAKSAGQLGMGGTKQSEEISTGKNVYVLTDGKWVDMQTSFAAMEEDKDSDPDTQKAVEASKCKALPDEVMFGQPASVYLQSIPTLGIETKVWISKATNRPVRSDMTNDAGSMKMLTVSRYEYAGVQAPAHVVTMEEMIKSKSGH